MLSRIARPALRNTVSVRSGTVAASNIASFQIKRFQSLRAEPSETFTKISDEKDPQRNKFFQYTWGSWLSDDASKKAQRETVFSIEGLAKTLEGLDKTRKDPKNIDKSGEPFIRAPITLADGTVVLTHNLIDKLLGESDAGLVVKNDVGLTIKTIASIHEGKHHRIYKITLASGKELVLRIPYKLDSDYSIAQKIKSEVATLDFLDLKLNARVPKVLAYGTSRANQLNSPFILMEHIEGDLLMKQWDPLAQDSEETQQKLKSVVDPIADFHAKVVSMTFNKFGSLYFHHDVSVLNQADVPYDGEVNPLLKNRWRIGPSVEKCFSKNKNKLTEAQINQHTGPWDASRPLDLVGAVADIELENIRANAVIKRDDPLSEASAEITKNQVKTLENLKTLAPKLINPKSASIMSCDELFKPRLYLPDLDPLNVILNKNDKNKPYFIDFEYATIKPFVLTNYPSFVAYSGVKVYNLHEDIPNYSEMDEVEQQQYQFMYYKTRNERLWELALNERRHDLIAVASPHIKVIKSPYLQALELKNEKDYLYVENSMIQLRAMWEAYVSNGLTNTENPEFPIKYDDDYIVKVENELLDYQNEILTRPFAATGGWIPQDMFDTLKEQGMIVKGEDGNYIVDTNKVLDEET